MKTQKLEILILFLCIFGFIGCDNKDEEAENAMKKAKSRDLQPEEKDMVSSMSVSSWQMQVLPQDMADMLASARTFMSV